MDIIRHPAKLLPTIILSVIWMAISYLMAMGKDTALVKWLNTLTYASGGMYGGSVGAAGIIFSTVLFIVGKASGGKAPSSSAVRNSLMGATAGFALSVPLTYLHQPLLLASAGFAILLLGILLAVLGKQKKPAQA